MQNFSLGVAGKDSVPSSNFSKLSEMSEMSWAKKLMFGLHVNIDKFNNDVTR